jgi:hypothetical protein
MIFQEKEKKKQLMCVCVCVNWNLILIAERSWTIEREKREFLHVDREEAGAVSTYHSHHRG